MTSDTKQLLLESLRNIPGVIFNLLWAAKDLPPLTRLSNMRNLVLSLPQAEKEEFRQECEFIRNVSLDRLADIKFPYKKKTLVSDDSYNETGRHQGLPYVVHKLNNKVFFPKSMSEQEALEAYLYFTRTEGILGGGMLAKSPHCYQDADFHIEDGDIILDVGCAEALFTLDNIDHVKHAYLFESDSKWNKPLHNTFAQYWQKTKIINKMVSDVNTKRSVRISDAYLKTRRNRTVSS